MVVTIHSVSLLTRTLVKRAQAISRMRLLLKPTNFLVVVVWFVHLTATTSLSILWTQHWAGLYKECERTYVNCSDTWVVSAQWIPQCPFFIMPAIFCLPLQSKPMLQCSSIVSLQIKQNDGKALSNQFVLVNKVRFSWPARGQYQHRSEKRW